MENGSPNFRVGRISMHTGSATKKKGFFRLLLNRVHSFGCGETVCVSINLFWNFWRSGGAVILPLPQQRCFPEVVSNLEDVRPSRRTPSAEYQTASYIIPCKKDDPKLNECAVRHGQLAIPKFINGDPKYRAPRLDPLDITELRVNQGTRQIGLRMILKNVKIYGLKNTVFTHARTGLRDKHIEWDFKIPKIEIISDYEVNGQVLILPITGKGKANVTLTKLEITYKYDWELIKKNGKEYMNFTSSELLFENGRTFFDLKNLFNGDEFLGNSMNRFLNENWREVTKELGPAVGQAFSNVFRLLLTRIAAQVPYNDIYLQE